MQTGTLLLLARRLKASILSPAFLIRHLPAKNFKTLPETDGYVHFITKDVKFSGREIEYIEKDFQVMLKLNKEKK